MRKAIEKQIATATAAAMLAVVSGPASALDGWNWAGMDIKVGGFLRQETAISTTGDKNVANQNGNVFQDRTVERQAYLPPEMSANLVRWGDLPIPFADTVRRSDFVPNDENDINYMIMRGEIEMGIRISDRVSFNSRLRAIYQPNVYDDFNGDSVSGFQGGITGGDSKLYHGQPNYMQYIVEGDRHPLPLEWSGRNYQVYFPTFFFEVTPGNGTTAIRIGNQQIAWGQALFFRTLDVPNGLDLRRHLILDKGLEEFSDKRTPQPSIRITSQLTDTLLVDAYISKFTPTVFGNPNTAYNVIPVQFTVHDMYAKNGLDEWDKVSFGLRFKGDYGQFGWQAGAVRRYNPDGVFRWTESGVVKPFDQSLGSVGSIVNTTYALKLPAAVGCPGEFDPTICRLYGSAAEAMSHSPFEVAPAGVYTADEWFSYAASTRLQAIEGFNAAVRDFPALQDAFQSEVADATELRAALNTDFMAAGGSLRGHLAREYFKETNLMLGGSYVLESENEFLNQLIFNLEAQYTPDRVFTAPDLSKGFKETDEYILSLVVDKWHRFSNDFPGTYLVFEILTKNKSDLVGRLLEGFDGSETKSAGGLSGNANYFVFGMTQPFPNKVFEVDFASLYDLRGGVFLQPLVRWNVRGNVTLEAFYNYVDGGLYGNPNNNLLSTIDYADEITIRASLKF
ncbi:hypothetical protein DFR24_3264 [Panacagrimonas perspica]|uniref:DUF1302 family protein n=1 Tax=Panacagrimonas perspica TaxID=381431 RepID=A0A4S3K2R8_9GAMM|nr:DUF1302 family protein [Panacagrimonas perspica]TDU28884.1 hypothetical protein DFR24_3264 [Panacagrimonas perspica]THD02289.1 hypothetical protein B1810_15285 [Panacagrimonas perspica]